MTTVHDALKQFGGVPVGVADGVMLAGGNWYFVDPSNGSDTANGLTPTQAKKTLQAAYNLCRDGFNDGVIFLGQATADNPAATIIWSKNYCHLIGADNALPGMGQRARVVGSAPNDISPIIEFSGAGCLVANMQFFQGGDAAGDIGCILASGDRNHFVNCFFAGGGNATPAGQAGMYSLDVTGDENTFTNCTIGLDTIARTSTNAELIVAGVHNRFVKCDIRKYSVTAGNFLVQIDSSAQDLRDVIFDDCLFFCYTPNWASALTNAFEMTVTNTVYVILKGECQFVGVSMTVADTVTYVYGAGAAPNAGMFISTNPTS